MTDFERGGILPFPGCHYLYESYTNHVIDAITDRAEWLWQQPLADTITHIMFRYGARLGTPVQHKASLQGLTTAAIPDGTILGGGSPASGLFTPPASTAWDGLVQTIALANSIALTRGQLLSIVIEPVGTPDGSNNSSFSVDNEGFSGFSQGFPRSSRNNAGVRTAGTHGPLIGLKSATRVHGYIPQSAQAAAFSTPDEVAICFNVAGPIGGTYKLAGVRAALSMALAKSFQMNLYEGTTVLQGPTTFDTDLVSTANNVRMFDCFFQDTNLVDLKYGQTYRVGFAPQEASVNFRLTCFQFAAAADMAGLNGGASMVIRSNRSSGGAWTDSPTMRPDCQLFIDSINSVPYAFGGTLG